MPIHRWNLLADLIIQNEYKVIAEVGVSKGANPSHLRGILEEKKYCLERYFAIDSFKDPYFAMDAAMKLKMASWQPWQLVEATSDEAYEIFKKLPLDLVFIDGSHVPEQMCTDIANYTKALRDGGCLVGHDYNLLFPTQYGDYAEITTFIDKYIGQENFNTIRDQRDECAHPCYLWWTYKYGEKYAKQRRPD